MQDTRKTKAQLIEELSVLRKRLDRLPHQPSSADQDGLAGTVLDRTPNSVVAVGARGSILYANKAAADLHGRTVEELQAGTLTLLHGPEQMPFVEAVLEQVLGGNEFAGEVWHTRADGTEFPTWTAVSQLPQSPGQAPAVVFSSRLILDEKEREYERMRIERRYREAFEASRDAYARLSIDGEILDFNSALCRMLEYEPRELLEMSIRDLTPEQWQGNDDHLLRTQVLTRGFSEVYEKELLRKDGATVPVELRTHLVRNEHGEPESVWAFVRDLRERRKAERSLRALEERFAKAFHANPAAVLLTRLSDDVVLDANESFLLACGQERSEVVGRKTLDLGIWTDPGAREHLLEQLRQGEWIRGREARYRDGQGTVRECVMSCESLQIDDEPCVLTVALDITDQRRVERVLQAERDFNETILEIAGALVVVLDRDGRIVRFNRACERTTGYTQAESAGQLVWELVVPPEQREEVRSVFVELCAGNYPAQHENYWVTRDGERRLISWSNSVQANESGKVQFVVATGLDVTEQRLAEQDLRRRVALDELIATLSARFINARMTAMDAGISDALERIGRFVEADRSYVFLYSDDKQRMSNTHEWCAEGIKAMRERLQDISVDTLPWFTSRMVERETVEVPEVAALPPEAEAERREWDAEQIKSLVCVPMLCRGELLGFLGFDAVRQHRAWHPEIVSLLRLVGEMLANLLMRSRAESALEASEEKYRSLVENIPAVSWTVDNSGRVLFVSPSVEQVSGFSAEEIAKQGAFLSRVHPEDFERARDAFAALFETGRIFDVEYRLKHKSGKWVWVHDRAVNTYRRDGVLCADGVAFDVTARKDAERALRRSEQRFRALVETTNDFIWETDEELRYIYASPQVAELFGLRVSDVMGRKVDELITPGESDCSTEKLDEFVGRRARFTGLSCSMQHRDGRAVLIETSGVPVFDADGHFAGYRGIARDITARTRAEEALRRSDRLAALGTMVAGVAHELNNPLTSICGLSQLLARDPSFSDQARHLAEEIVEQGRRCGRIVENLLGFARERRVVRQNVSLNELLANCLRITRYDPRFEGITHKTHFQSDLPEIAADPYQLEQVFINILNNARDALQEVAGRRHIEIETSRQDQGVRVEFRDSGPGISDPGKVFDPFYTTKVTGSGTGLGLSVSYGIVQEHGGDITARNVDGGASFIVTLPLAPPNVSAEVRD